MNFISRLAVDYDLLALVHCGVNLGIFGICICRLGRMHNMVLRRVKAQYIILTVVAVANAFAPILFQQWPSVVSVIFSATVLGVLWSDNYMWTRGKHGVPTDAETKPGDLI